MSKTIPAAEAKTNFGSLLDTAQKEPVTISRNGRPVAVVVSIDEYEAHAALKLARLRQEIAIGIDQLDKGQGTDGKIFMESLIEKLE